MLHYTAIFAAEKLFLRSESVLGAVGFALTVDECDSVCDPEHFK